MASSLSLACAAAALDTAPTSAPCTPPAASARRAAKRCRRLRRRATRASAAAGVAADLERLFWLRVARSHDRRALRRRHSERCGTHGRTRDRGRGAPRGAAINSSPHRRSNEGRNVSC